MKTTHITTSHNVAIEYELATVMQRFLALLLDLLVMTGWLIVCSIIAAVAGRNSEIILYVLWFPAFFFYNLVCEIFFNGQSIGKRAIGIKVVKLNGQTPKIGDYFLRWAFRVVDLLLSLGALAALFVAGTEKSQRIGDMMAGTAVIKLNPRNKFTIKDILTIKDSSGYEPTYPDVVQFSDDDMLLIKNSLDRVKKYPNKAHFILINELSKKVCSELGLNEPKEKVPFLRTVLQDYIVLTR